MSRSEAPLSAASATTDPNSDAGQSSTARHGDRHHHLHRHHHRHHHHHHRAQPHWNKYANRSTNGSVADLFENDHGPGTATPPGMQRYHDLSHTNKSVQDLGLLDRLVDDRTGQHEDKRATDEFLASVAKRKNGSAVRAYYEKLNAVLDGWREVDEILDSHFPEEVMLRFGTVEEVDRFNGTRKRLPWMNKRRAAVKARQRSGHKGHEDHSDDDDNDSGYQEESESEHDEEGQDPRAKRRQSQLARVASAAFSGFWFGTPTKSDRIPRRDEESGLLGQQPPTPSSLNAAPYFTARRDYGATPRQDSPSVPRLTVIRDEDASAKTPPADTNGESAGGEHLPNDSSTAQQSPGPKDPQRALSADGSADEESLTLAATKLDRRIAEERKGRDRTRAAAIAATGSTARNKSSAERSTSIDKAKSKSQPGGLSERDRKRLLRHVPGREEREGERERGTNFAININLAVNVLLIAGKVVAVFSSNSVSLIASLVDSALDLLSTIIIFGTSKAISYRSFHTYFKYPVGKKRFEPLGVVIFAVLMIASFCQVLVESVERLYTVIRTGNQAPAESSQLPFVGIAFMVLTIIIKMFMWLIYRKSPSSGVRAVAQDAENDVVFNVASLIFPVIGSRLGWPALDPIGGVCLSIYIISEWLETLTETVSKLTGAVGSSQDISRALYLILRFQSVRSVSAFELYHAGDDMIVEADVVLPHSLALKEAHDLGEIITYCTEGIVQIERAYIHLDYNPVGQAGHITGRG